MANSRNTSPFVEEVTLMRDSNISKGSARKLGRFDTLRARFFKPNVADSSELYSSNFASDDMEMDGYTTTVTTADLDEHLLVDIAEEDVLRPLAKVVSVSKHVFNYYTRQMRSVAGTKGAVDHWIESYHDPNQSLRLPPLFLALNLLTGVVHPSRGFARFWIAFIMIMDLLYSAFFVPISVAFCEIKTATYDWCSLVDIMAGAVYAVNLVMGFCIGYVLVRGDKQVTILSRRLLARFYVLRGSFLTDCLSTAPWIYAVLDISGAFRDGVKYDYARVLLVIRMLRIVRILPLLKSLLSSGYARPNGISNMLPASFMYSIIMAYTAGVIVNLFACTMYTIAKFEGLENSWIARYDYANSAVVPPPNILASKSKLRQYVLSVYWIVTTMTTVGYGDVVAVTVPEQVAMVVVMLSGVMVFGILVSSISESLSHASDQYRRAQLLRTKLSDIHHWLKNIQVDRNSSRLILAWYSGAWKHDQELSREEDILEDLPWLIRRDVSSFINKDTLRRIRFFGIPADPARDASIAKRFQVGQLVEQVKAFGAISVQKGLGLISKMSTNSPVHSRSVPSNLHAQSFPALRWSAKTWTVKKDRSPHSDQEPPPAGREGNQQKQDIEANPAWAGTSEAEGLRRQSPFGLHNDPPLAKISSDVATRVSEGCGPLDATVVIISSSSDRQLRSGDLGRASTHHPSDTRRSDKPPLHTRSMPAGSLEIKDSPIPLMPSATADSKHTRASLWTQESDHGRVDKPLTPEGLLPLLASIMQSVEAMPLQDICTEGDVADSMWILEEGELTVTKTARARFRKSEQEHDFWLARKDPATESQEVILRASPDRPVLIGHGSLLRLDLLECMYCLHTIRARTFCQLWVIKMDVFRPILKHNPQLEARLMNTLRDEMVSHLQGFHHEADPVYPWIDMCFFLRRTVKPGVCEHVADRLKDYSWGDPQQQGKLLTVMRCVARSSWKKNVEPIDRLLRRKFSTLSYSGRSGHSFPPVPPRIRLQSEPSNTGTANTSRNSSVHDSAGVRSPRIDRDGKSSAAVEQSHGIAPGGGDTHIGQDTNGQELREREGGHNGDSHAEAGGDASHDGGHPTHRKHMKKIILKGIPSAFRKVRNAKLRHRGGASGNHPAAPQPAASETEMQGIRNNAEVQGNAI